MARSVIVDLGGLFRGSGSLLRRRWGDVGALTPRFARVRAEGWPGPLPALEPVNEAVAAFEGAAEVRLYGQPGAVRAANLWAPALSRPIPGVDSPSAAPGPAVALVGPAWVDEAVDALVSAGHRVAVACKRPASGEAIDPPSGGRWIEDAWAGEGTRGPLGAGVLTAAALSGLDVAAALDGAAAMSTLCDGPLADNPAWSLARGLRLLASERARDSVVHVAGGAELLPLAEWAARAQAVRLAPASVVAPARPAPVAVRADDEDWATFLRAGGPERVVVSWSGPGDTSGGWIDAAEEVGLSVIRLRLPGVDAASLGGAVMLWLRALGALAALEERGG